MKTPKHSLRKVVSFLNNEEEDGGFRLPNIQRPFVWTEEQIARLFDSILREYPVGRQHAAHRRRPAAAAQGGAAVKERGLARGRHAQERAGDVGEAVAGGPRRGLSLPRRDRAAEIGRASCRERV